ncbi:MAG: M50 family metallopeptidase [Patescibacteria group bacterium]
MTLLITILGFLFAIFMIVIVHEFGHFIAAKRSGVRVDEFAFGFPPNLWRKSIGETTYSVNLILLGGFVKLYGEDGSDEKDPTSYASKPPYIKILILVAGVFLNFVLGWFILFGCYLFGMQPIAPGMADHKGVVNNTKVIIGIVEKDSPAEKNGLQKEDIIKKVDGKTVSSSDDVLIYINNKTKETSGNIKVGFTIERNGQTQEKEIETYTAKEMVGKREIERTRIGVVVEDKGNIKATSIVTAFTASIKEFGRIVSLTVEGIVNLFKKLFLHFQVSDEASGPVGIYKAMDFYIQRGLSQFVQLIAMLSIAIGLFNIIPIPGLDGGHVLIVLVESVFKRKFSNKTKNIIQFAGFGAIIVLFIVVSFKDLFKFGII